MFYLVQMLASRDSIDFCHYLRSGKKIFFSTMPKYIVVEHKVA